MNSYYIKTTHLNIDYRMRKKLTFFFCCQKFHKILRVNSSIDACINITLNILLRVLQYFFYTNKFYKWIIIIIINVGIIFFFFLIENSLEKLIKKLSVFIETIWARILFFTWIKIIKFTNEVNRWLISFFKNNINYSSLSDQIIIFKDNQ